jgi:hypothetical protein
MTWLGMGRGGKTGVFTCVYSACVKCVGVFATKICKDKQKEKQYCEMTWLGMGGGKRQVFFNLCVKDSNWTYGNRKLLPVRMTTLYYEQDQTPYILVLKHGFL